MATERCRTSKPVTSLPSTSTAAAGRLVEPGEQPHDRGLARQRRSQQHAQRPALERHRDVADIGNAIDLVGHVFQRHAHVRAPASRKGVPCRAPMARHPASMRGDLVRRHPQTELGSPPHHVFRGARPFVRHEIPDFAFGQVAPKVWPRSAAVLAPSRMRRARCHRHARAGWHETAEERIIAQQFAAQRRNRRDVQIAAGQRRRGGPSGSGRRAMQVAGDIFQRLFGEPPVGRYLAAKIDSSGASPGVSSSMT